MELWFEEHNTDDVHFALRVKKQLFSQKSDFQQIDLYDTYEFGRMLVMDGAIMLTEKDEFIYHEMIVHVAMAVHPNVKKVLIIGGGDGGALRELCRYSSVEQIEMVEIDPLVVDVAKEYLPTVASSFSDPRLKLVFEDGLRYVRNLKRDYDLMIIDSTDPFGPGESLFTREFYANCSKGLREDGIRLISTARITTTMQLKLIRFMRRRLGFLTTSKSINTSPLIRRDIGSSVLCQCLGSQDHDGSLET